MLDMRSVVLSGVLIDVICTLVVAVLWRQNRSRFAGLGFWAADYALQTAGLLLIVLRGAIPDWASIVLANACVITGAFLGLLGLEAFTGRRGRHAHNVALVVLFLVLHLSLTYLRPSLYLRSANIALTLLLICAQCAWLALYRVGPAMRAVTTFTGLVFAAYCLLFSVRIVSLLLIREAPPAYFQSGLAESAFMLGTQMAFVLLTYALILMVNRRLVFDLQKQEEKYSKAFHAAPYAVSLTRLSDGKIIEANEWLRRSAGCAYEELLGKTTLELALWKRPADRAALMAKLRAAGRLAEEEVVFTNKRGQDWTGLLSAEIIVIDGEPCVLACMNDITGRKRAEAERERLIAERERALSEVKVMSGLLPICASCKKIRDEKGQWQQMEVYVHAHSQAEFSHGLCPECEHPLWTEGEGAPGQAVPKRRARAIRGRPAYWAAAVPAPSSTTTRKPTSKGRIQAG
jgi:PAS domain S-box-containing protein